MGCTSTTKKKNTFTIVGTWSGVDETGKKGSFIFDNEGYCILKIGKSIIGGKNYQGKGSLEYKVNFNVRPIHLDLIAYKPDGRKRGQMLLIMKIIDDKTIKIRMNFSKVRPRDFENDIKKDIMILRKE